MKRIIFIILFAGIGLISSAQKVNKKELPANVQLAFEKLYPKTQNVKWEIADAGYEASFIFNSKKTSAVIDVNGNLIESEEEISITMLPKPAIAYFHKNYPKEKIKETAKIVDYKGVVTYEIGLKKIDLLFDVQGNFIKKTK